MMRPFHTAWSLLLVLALLWMLWGRHYAQAAVLLLALVIHDRNGRQEPWRRAR